VASRVWVFVFWGAVLLCVVLPSMVLIKPLIINELGLVKVGTLLTTIFVVAVFMERSQEVLLTAMRAYGSETLGLEIRRVQRLVHIGEKNNKDDAVVDALQNQLEALRLQRLNYRAHTRIIALRFGLLFGLLISVAGIRTLGILVDEQLVSSLPVFQGVLFHGIDVLLTGGVIAGGSDGIHKMAELYRAYVESRACKHANDTEAFELSDN